MARNLRIGDIVKDSYGRKGMVAGFINPPDDDWFEIQESQQLRGLMKRKHEVRWVLLHYNVPFGHGAAYDAEPRVRLLRRARTCRICGETEA